jgi:uncharacterized protein VirK/YbjX
MLLFNKRPLRSDSPKAIFRATDDAAGGWLQTTKRLVKFRLRYWLCKKQLHSIREFFISKDLRALFDTDLPMLLRPMRPYLWRGLNAAQRTTALLTHFDWLIQHFAVSDIQKFYEQGSHVLFAQTYPEGVVCLTLQPGRGLGREGELELHLKLNDVSVMRTAFSILPCEMVGVSGVGSVLVIGNMQGIRNANQEIKIVTQKMERTRPHNIVMTALQGLVKGMMLTGMVGVADDKHVYSSYRTLSKRVGQSYDTLWQELGAQTRTNTAHWNLPTVWEPKSEQDVPSSKRSQLRRKNEIRQKIFDEVCANAQRLA